VVTGALSTGAFVGKSAADATEANPIKAAVARAAKRNWCINQPLKVWAKIRLRLHSSRQRDGVMRFWHVCTQIVLRRDIYATPSRPIVSLPHGANFRFSWRVSTS
jgi:hypothetical protein